MDVMMLITRAVLILLIAGFTLQATSDDVVNGADLMVFALLALFIWVTEGRRRV